MHRTLPGLCLLLSGFLSPLVSQGLPLSEEISQLFTFGVCGRPLCLDGSVNAANGHGDHYLPDLATSNAAIISFLTGSIAENTSSVPTTASAGGITYKFVGGLPVRTSESVGPIFAERAQPIGRGRLVVGTRYATAELRTLRGVPIDQLELNFTHQNVGSPALGDPVLENDVLRVNLALNVGLDVTSVFLAYGVSDRLDVSVVVPLVHTTMQARAAAQILPFGSTAVHFFSGSLEHPELTAESATFGSYTGLGDLSVRGKASLYATDHYGISVLGDLRLPTGDEANFAGSGSVNARALLIASARLGTFSPHLNLGYQYRGSARANDVILATVGFDQPTGSWATLAGEIVAEWQPGGNATTLPGTVTYTEPFVRTVEPTNIPNTKDNRVLGSFGAKFRTATNGPILLVDMLVPIVRGGLQPTVMWTIGFDMEL
ncbi:MAG: hypothetical protein ABI542_10810 [Gemmatimonadota bacterium]